jgi:hypothetical protein
MEKVLDDNTQKQLRTNAIINQNEVAMKVGDIFLAENVLTKSRRIIEVNLNLTEATNKSTLLKG